MVVYIKGWEAWVGLGRAELSAGPILKEVGVWIDMVSSSLDQVSPAPRSVRWVACRC